MCRMFDQIRDIVAFVRSFLLSYNFLSFQQYIIINAIKVGRSQHILLNIKVEEGGALQIIFAMAILRLNLHDKVLVTLT